MIKIAHISDLHFTSDRVGAGAHTDEHLMHAVSQRIQAEEGIDYGIVSGDLTNDALENSLLLARDWITAEIALPNNIRSGLGWGDETRPTFTKLGVVPGNHDTWRSIGLGRRYRVGFQESLEKFSNVFNGLLIGGESAQTNVDERGLFCAWDWIEDNGHDVFIAFMDSSYLCGNLRDRHLFPTLSKVARGKIAVEQSARLLRWYDLGIRGQLSKSPKQPISRDRFRRALKVLVIHHYLVEPKGAKVEPLLHLRNVQTVIQNCMLANFDMVMCGHKHFQGVELLRYSDYIDRRARRRWARNLLRQQVSLDSQPILVDSAGRRASRLVSMAIEIAARFRLSQRGDDDAADRERLEGEIVRLVTDPQSILDTIAADKSRASASKKQRSDELHEIGVSVLSRLSHPDRQQIARTMARTIRASHRRWEARSLAQVMSGSTTKKQSGASEARGYNLYEIELGVGTSPREVSVAVRSQVATQVNGGWTFTQVNPVASLRPSQKHRTLRFVCGVE